VSPRPAAPFPRRALVISVHNYLYANPVHNGMPLAGADNLKNFVERGLMAKLRIPPNQIAHLSDMAGKGKVQPPMKKVIENTLKSFVETSRRQDRIMVFFIGHSVEIENEVYLAPIEAELDKAASLIPLKWVFQQLEQCKARQKVLVLDVNRLNPTLGQERPGSGPMGGKLEAAIKAAPAGIQVWSACVEKQYSYETDDMPMGAFLTSFYQVLNPPAGRKGLEGKIQRAGDPFPLDQINELINLQLKAELDPLKLEQTARLSGKEPEGAVEDELQSAPEVTLAAAPMQGKGNDKLIRDVLAEIGTPPVKVSPDDLAIKFDVLPPFAPDVLKSYEDTKGDPKSRLHVAIHKVRSLLWAASAMNEPRDVAEEVQKVRQELQFNLTILKDGYRAPAGGNAETRFKDMVLEDEKKVARILFSLTEALDELKGVEEDRDKESRRWQANYDFILARLQAQIAYLYEYQSMLGQMRKEFPRRDPNLHGGWKLAAQTTLNGDATGKKLAKSSLKILDKLAQDHVGTPWEVLAKREKLTALGLEWQPAK
jgi:hypothetical protein